MVRAADLELDMSLFGGDTGVTKTDIAKRLLGEKEVVVAHISKPGRLEQFWDALTSRVSLLFKSKSFGARVAEYHVKVIDSAFNPKGCALQEFLRDDTVFEPAKITDKELKKPWRLQRKPKSKSAKKADKVALASSIAKPRQNSRKHKAIG